MVNFVYGYPIEAILIVCIFFIMVIAGLLVAMRFWKRKYKALNTYEKSYHMVTDFFIQAGIEYDFRKDRFTVLGGKSDTIDIPNSIDGFHDKLKRRQLRMTLTAEEFDQLCSNKESGKSYQTEFQCGMKESGWNWFNMIYTVVYTEEADRKPDRLIGCLVDAQKQHQTQEKLTEMGEYDKLTGIYNRVGAESKMIEALLSLEEYSEKVFLLMDIDRFKQMNDNCGHLCGDDVLREIGKNIQEIFQGDTIACRWGGDEFTMLVRGPGAEKELLEKRIQELRRRMKVYRYGDKCYPVSLSIGGIIPKTGITLEKLFRQADEVLYQVKDHGRDNYMIKNGAAE